MAKLNIQAANQQQMLQNLSMFANDVKNNDVVAAGKKEGIYGDASNHGKKAAFRTAKGDRQRLVSQLKTLGDKHFKNDPAMKKTWEAGLQKFTGKNGQYNADVKGSEFKAFVKDMVEQYKLGQMIQNTLTRCAQNDMPLAADSYTNFAKDEMAKGNYKKAASTLDDMKQAFKGKLDFLGPAKQKIELQEYKKLSPIKSQNNASVKSQQLSPEQIKTRDAAMSMLVNQELQNVNKPIFQQNSQSQSSNVDSKNAKMNHPGVSAQDVADFNEIADVLSSNITPGGPADLNKTPGGPMVNDVAVDNMPDISEDAEVVNKNDVTPGMYQEQAMEKISYFIDSQIEGH